MLSFNNVSFGYNKHTILDNINIDINKGDLTFLIGKSGSGKSTFLKLIYMDVFPEKGYVNFDGYNSTQIKKSDISKLRQKMGIIFQDFKMLKDRNIFDNLAYVLEVTGRKNRNSKKLISDVLADVGLLHKKYSFANELSGGEIQRAAIARAIINQPDIIIADEPTGNLDPVTTSEIVDILLKINKKGTTLLLATHNYEIIKQNNAKIYKLENKQLKENPIL